MSQQVYQVAAEIANPVTPTTANTVYQVGAEISRNIIQYLYVTGAIGDHKIDSHVIEMRRYSSLCNPGQRITLHLDSSFPGDIVPGLPVVIYERGVKVLTGYVVRISRQRPSYDWQVEIDDTYTRVYNYFIPEPMLIETPSSAKFLIHEILDPTGITVQIHGLDVATPPGLNLGLRPAHDALNDILAYGSWYAWVDAEGVLHLKQYASVQPVVIDNPISVESSLGTEQTRNVVRVYGQATEPNQEVNYFSNNWFDGLLVDLTTVVANPMINNFNDAQRIADFLLHELGSLTHIVSFDIEGDPSLQIGTSGSLHYQDPVTNVLTEASGPITALETKIDKSGYITTVTVGERCPRISGWSVPTNSIRAIWVGARGGIGDTRREKLIWSSDYGLGGQPTWNIMKTIPTGELRATHVTRDGSTLYAIFMTEEDNLFTLPRSPGDPPPSKAIAYRLWRCKNPYNLSPEWDYVVGSGDGVINDVVYIQGLPVGRMNADGVDSGWDYGSLGVGMFGSMQTVGNTLYFTMRMYRDIPGVPFTTGTSTTWFAVNKDGTGSIDLLPGVPSGTGAIPFNTVVKANKVKGYEHSWPPADPTTDVKLSGTGTKDAYFRNYFTGGLNYIGFFPYSNLSPSYLFRDNPSFDFNLVNGIERVGSSQRIASSMWCNDRYVPLASKLYYVYDDGVRTPVLKADQSVLMTSVNIAATTPIRGDYFGTQVQFTDILGNLFVAQDGVSFANKFQWLYGAVVCIDPKNPGKMGWFPNTNINANEISRYSSDGGATWMNMTGNWWGSSSEVLAGTKMQAVGDLQIIDVHPTFWPSEVIVD